MTWYFRWPVIFVLMVAHATFRDVGITVPDTGAIFDMRDAFFALSAMLAVGAGSIPSSAA